MTNLTLRQLRYIEALAHHRHFGKAAAACFVSQPAISVQIKEVEEGLGAALFERLPRSVRLTPFGRDFVARARDVLQAVDDLEELADAAHSQWVGQLRLGIIPTIAPYLLPRVLADLGREMPSIDVHIRETMTANLIDDLKEGSIDAAILALPISEPHLTEYPLFDERFVLVRPQADAAAPVPNREKLREMQLLLLEEGHCFRDQALSFCNIPEHLSLETMEGTSLSTLVQIVGSGVGVTLIPEMAVGVETRSAAVSLTRLDAPEPSRTVGLVWREKAPRADQLRQLGEIVRKSGQELLAQVGL